MPRLIAAFALALAPFAAFAQPAPVTRAPFNDAILRTVEMLSAQRASGGYDINRAFTRDLAYGAQTIPASRAAPGDPPPLRTMCVAAVAEAIIEAINAYAAGNAEHEVYRQLTRATWTSGTRDSIRANLFMFDGAGSLGTAHTLSRFGIGAQLPFSELRAGDFINFNRAAGPGRRASGHAVIFMGYLDRAGQAQAAFSADVAGFRYFSAQGGADTGGFGFRNAWFGPYCPSPRRAGVDDCNVIRAFAVQPDGSLRQNQALLNSGRMFHPGSWDVARAALARRAAISRGLEDEALTRGVSLEALVEETLEQELRERPDRHIDGSDDPA